MEQDQQQLRNLRDFLLVYNRMTEICFQRCTSNLNYRNLTMDEERCVDSCAGKLIRSNHRLMGTYVQLMPGIVQRRMEEMEAKSGEMAKSAAAATGASAETISTAPLPEGTVAESALAPTSVGLAGDIPPVTTSGVDVSPIIAPPTGGVTDITPAIVQPTGRLTVDIPPVIAPSNGGAVVDTPSVVVAPPGGLTADIPPNIMPPSATGEIAYIAPPTGGVTVDDPPVFVAPVALETFQIPPVLSPAPVEPPATAPAPAVISQPSATLKSLPDLAAPPPMPPIMQPEILSLPQQVDQPGPSNQDPLAQVSSK